MVHRDYRSCVLGQPIFDNQSAAVAMLAPSGGIHWFVVAHLDPRRAHHYYQETLNALERLFQAAPLGSTIITSIDANDSLALPRQAPTSAVGPFTAGIAAWKGKQLRSLFLEYGIVAANTWTESPIGAATCTYDGRFPPKQTTSA